MVIYKFDVYDFNINSDGNIVTDSSCILSIKKVDAPDSAEIEFSHNIVDGKICIEFNWRQEEYEYIFS